MVYVYYETKQKYQFCTVFFMLVEIFISFKYQIAQLRINLLVMFRTIRNIAGAESVIRFCERGWRTSNTITQQNCFLQALFIVSKNSFELDFIAKWLV